MDRETKREIIMDYSKDTTHRGLINDDRYFKENTRSDSCIDNMDMMVKLNNDIIEDVLFDGEACAICTSATSIWSDILIGKTIDEAKKIVEKCILASNARMAAKKAREATRKTDLTMTKRRRPY